MTEKREGKGFTALLAWRMATLDARAKKGESEQATYSPRRSLRRPFLVRSFALFHFRAAFEVGEGEEDEGKRRRRRKRLRESELCREFTQETLQGARSLDPRLEMTRVKMLPRYNMLHANRQTGNYTVGRPISCDVL